MHKIRTGIRNKLRSFLGITDDQIALKEVLEFIDSRLSQDRSKINALRKDNVFIKNTLMEFSGNFGLSDAALKEVARLMEQKIKEIADTEQRATLWYNLEQRNEFLQEVQDYISNHHHDSLYERKNKV